MLDLSELDSYLTESGKNFLEKWGIRLAGLYNGTLHPAKPNEISFVEVFNKGAVPEGASEIFWFNAIAISNLVKACTKYEGELSASKDVQKGLVARINHQEMEIEKRVKPLQLKVEEQHRALLKCWATIDKYERQLGIQQSLPNKSGQQCPVCQGTGGMGNCSRCDGKGYL
jgi:uncharacterized protein YifE (UPF0438 family)